MIKRACAHVECALPPSRLWRVPRARTHVKSNVRALCARRYDGNLNPNGTFTRAEAAKIVTFMLIGADAANRLAFPSADPFSDVPRDNWAAPFIAYAKEVGIIAGRGDGSYGPSDQLTGSAVAKLMNTVLGYGKQGEYSGPSWELNAISNALARGLITGDADLSSPASRQEVFQYIFNTLRPDPLGYAKNYIVEYSNVVNAYLPAGSNAFQGTENVKIDSYLGAKIFGLAQKINLDAFGVNWRTWTRNGRNLVGDNKYLAETVVDEFVTEKIWTGGDLALAYEWDDAIEIWVNGERILTQAADWGYYTGYTYMDSGVEKQAVGHTTTFSQTRIRRGDKNNFLSDVGLKVQLFDNGDYAGTRVDNGSVGKIVITYEYLAQITKVDAATKTVDLKFWSFEDGNVKTVDIRGVPTDVTYALNDYALIILANDSYDYIMDADEIGSGAIGAYHADKVILRDLKVEDSQKLEVRATNYTQAPKVGGVNGLVALATLTADGTKYIFDSFYRFGLNDVPRFDADAMLILDSNGRVIGVTGDVAGPAAYKYVFVEGIHVTGALTGFSAPRVRASVYFGATGATKVVDLPVTRSGNDYVVTINNKTMSVSDIDVDNNGLVEDASAALLLGWYWYTSADDADTISLRSNRAGVGSIFTETTYPNATSAPYNVFAVGHLDRTLTSVFSVRSVNGGFYSDKFATWESQYGVVRVDSKTVTTHNGARYTGTSLPVGSANYGTPDGYALAVRGNDGLIKVIYGYNPNTTRSSTATYAVIRTIPWDGGVNYNEGKLDYVVVGSTAAITTAGVYEDTTTYERTYAPGDIVDVELQSDGTYRIVNEADHPGGDFRDYISDATASSGYTYIFYDTVTYVHPTYEFFQIAKGTDATKDGTLQKTVQLASTPFVDKFKEDAELRKEKIEDHDKVEVGDIVKIAIKTDGSGAVEAIVLVTHAGAESVRYALDKTLGTNTYTWSNIDGNITATKSVTAAAAKLTPIFRAAESTAWETAAKAQIDSYLNSIIPSQLYTYGVSAPFVGDGNANITATVYSRYNVQNKAGALVPIRLNLTITDAPFTGANPIPEQAAIDAFVATFGTAPSPELTAGPFTTTVFDDGVYTYYGPYYGVKAETIDTAANNTVLAEALAVGYTSATKAAVDGAVKAWVDSLLTAFAHADKAKIGTLSVAATDVAPGYIEGPVSGKFGDDPKSDMNDGNEAIQYTLTINGAESTATASLVFWVTGTVASYSA